MPEDNKWRRDRPSGENWLESVQAAGLSPTNQELHKKALVDLCSAAHNAIAPWGANSQEIWMHGAARNLLLDNAAASKSSSTRAAPLAALNSLASDGENKTLMWRDPRFREIVLAASGAKTGKEDDSGCRDIQLQVGRVKNERESETRETRSRAGS